MQGIHRVMLGSMKAVLVGLMALMIFTVAWGVFSRFILNDTASWTTELASYTLAWITFLGSAWAIFKRTHIRFDNLIELFPNPIKILILVLFNVTMITFLGIVMYYGTIWTQASMSNETLTLPVTQGILYMILPLACLLMIIGMVIETVQLFRKE